MVSQKYFKVFFCNIAVMNPFRISVVSYLNSRPFMLGLSKSGYMKEHAIITTDNPAECAEKVRKGEADLGLIPVAVLPELGEYHIHSDFCIGAKGKVDSVFLYSQVPVKEIRRIITDPQSRTSVALTKVLSRFYWKIDPEWIKAGSNGSDYLKNVTGETAAVMIGDRTFEVGDRFAYRYDLAEEWMQFTGLPFVFACWAGRKPLPDKFISEFNKALEFGVEHREDVITAEEKNFTGFNIRNYLLNNITYVLDSSKREALNLFLSLFNKLG